MWKLIGKIAAILLAIALVAGATYLIVSLTSNNNALPSQGGFENGVPASGRFDRHGQIPSGDGDGNPSQYFPRLDRNRQNFIGRGNTSGITWLRFLGVGKSLVTIALTVLGVLLVQWIIRKTRRKPVLAAVNQPVPAPMDSEQSAN